MGWTATRKAILRLAMAALIGGGALNANGVAGAQQRIEPGSITSPDQNDPLTRLFQQASTGEADPHLPFVLSRLKRALADQDLLGFLSLVDPTYFENQFALLAASGRNPGEAMGQFACEFFSVCDIAKRYSFNDIVAMELISVSPEGGLAGGLAQVTLELRMWDGLSVRSTIFYDTGNARLSAAVG